MSALPKSLHTVRILVAVAIYVATSQGRRPNAEDVETAARIIGHGGEFWPDPHGLKAKAAAQLAPSKPRPAYSHPTARACAMLCGLAAVAGDIYCEGCRSGEDRRGEYPEPDTRDHSHLLA